MPPRRTPTNDADQPGRRGQIAGERELIVVAAPQTRTRAFGEGAAPAPDAGALAGIVADAGATIRPLFGANPDRLRNEMTSRAAPGVGAADLPDLSVYYRVDAPDEKLDDLANELRAHSEVAAAYVKPAAQPAVAVQTTASTPQYRPPSTTDRITDPLTSSLNDMLPRADEAPPATPDFSARQIYLQPAPAGI